MKKILIKKAIKLGCIVFFSILIGCNGHKAAGNKQAQAFEDLGNAFIGEGKAREALENYLEAYKINPNSPDLNHELALVYRILGQYDVSLQYFEKALVLRPKFPDAQNNLGVLYLLMGKWDLAIERFQAAINELLYRTPQYAYNNMGLAYYAKGDYPNAIDNYKKALQYLITYSLCYKNLGMAYEANANWKEAIDSYQNAIKYSTPEDSEFSLSHFLLGRLYLKMGKKKEAKDLLQKAIEIDPRAPFVEEAQKLLNSIKS
jgi:tetratricopeptide (TPR) repeat protein